MKRSWLQTIPALFLLFPALSSAQVTNGDFEAGNTGWNVASPPGWTVVFQAAGGNPNGYLNMHSPFGNSAGEVCASQTFDCGPAGINGNCIITVDFQLMIWDASPGTGRARIFIDGVLVFSSTGDNIPWTTLTFTVPCGTHRLDLCLQVDPGNNGWDICYDNVTARCEPIIPIEQSTWGGIKALYR